MGDGLDDARGLLPGVRLDLTETLSGGSERSTVRRALGSWPDGSQHELIVKTFHGAGENWVRESAALALAAPGAPIASFVVAGSAPPTIVMADLGRGTNLADALLGDDSVRATAAIVSWAGAIARLHRSTLHSRADFRAELAARSGDLPVSESTMASAVDDAARLLEQHCLQLDVAVPPGAMADLRGLPRRLNSAAAGALSPDDACPDNNVSVGSELMLIDFEGAQWRHVAWDVAYLRVPWPSCWCSWRMPADVSERALERYRATIEDELPYVRTPQFRSDVAVAAAGWALISTSWLLPKALADDPPPNDPAKLTPTRRAMILHRLDGARRVDELPALAELTGRLRQTLVERWGEVPLAYAPAFWVSS